MDVAILSARHGWHTSELCRALAAHGHRGVVLPYEQLVACIGSGGVQRGPLATDPSGGDGSEGPSLRTRNVAFDDDPARRTPDRASGRDGSEDLSLRAGNVAFDVSHGAVLHSRSGPDSADLVALTSAGAVLARIIPNGSLEQIIFRVNTLHWLERRGITVVNSARTIERCVDKCFTTALLHEAGLPVPETVVCENVTDAMAAMRRLRDVVVKPLFGSMGHGLIRLAEPDVAWRVFRSLEQTRAVFYVQRAIAHDGRDVRAFVVGGRVIGAIEREAPAGDWRTNVSRGGRARPIDLPAAWKELAVRAAAAVDADYAGVDLLTDAAGSVYVLEVNGIPGWEGLQRATGLDVAGEIVSHLLTRMVASAGAAQA